MADTTICVLGSGSSATHSILIGSTPPAEPGFEPPLVLAMQKPAAHKPSADAIAAAEALMQPQQQDMGGGAAAASSTSAASAQMAAAHGKKRKRGQSEAETECDGSVCDGSAAAKAAEPLC